MGRSIFGLVLLLNACGGNAQDAQGASCSGGSSAAGAENGGAPAAGAATSRASGDGPLVDISGRWGLLGFEDPVGVQIDQRGETIGGEGCDVYAPPLQAEDQPWLCGPLSGSIVRERADFGFHFLDSDYAADVTVSADGQRMTGRFHGVSEWQTAPTAWLRVADGASWLSVPPPPHPKEALYSLELTAADGDEYRANEGHRLVAGYHGGLSGSLGSFWNTETRLSADGKTLDVGPVPLTTPELPVTMSLAIEDGEYTELSATTGSGHHYAFRMVRAD